jgi:hypothetical protein
VLGDISCGVKKVNTLKKRSASRSTHIVLDNQQILLTLVTVSSECDVDGNLVVG